MPTSMQTILAAVSDLNVDKTAEIADRILEVTPTPTTIFSVSGTNSSFEERLSGEINKLNKRVDLINWHLAKVDLRFAGTGFEPADEVCPITGIFVGTSADLVVSAGKRNVFHHVHIRETPTAESRGGIFFAQWHFPSPVRAGPEN
ncbi:hypothetical protein JTE90_013104 [Oedothorax gibbosus]|uniref:Uncharacterized protein n=1 Tax=Oedothorax gibbosus TaxID=931172 RepID=A0AAV6TUG0_9ARAC|nr:hypothetical protein JTE90_013104 [Oedothorax gibbosus]